MKKAENGDPYKFLEKITSDLANGQNLHAAIVFIAKLLQVKIKIILQNQRFFFKDNSHMLRSIGIFTSRDKHSFSDNSRDERLARAASETGCSAGA